MASKSDSLTLLAEANAAVPCDHCANSALRLAALWRNYKSQESDVRNDRRLVQTHYRVVEVLVRLAERMEQIEACASAIGCAPQFHALIAPHNTGEMR
jgi:hypothetical protein